MESGRVYNEYLKCGADAIPQRDDDVDNEALLVDKGSMQN
jgi:hypothetical protein